MSASWTHAVIAILGARGNRWWFNLKSSSGWTCDRRTRRRRRCSSQPAIPVAGFPKSNVGAPPSFLLVYGAPCQNPNSEQTPDRRSSRRDGGCPRAVRAPTVGIKRARYATPSTVAPAWSAKRCEHARPQDSLTIAQRLRRGCGLLRQLVVLAGTVPR